MMTEKEMLEAAALAARLKVIGDADSFGTFTGLRILSPLHLSGYWWNPRQDNGQALELASALCLTIKPGKYHGDGCTVESRRPGVAACTAFDDDPAKQMRTAIFRVAAEIGVVEYGYKSK